MGPIWCRQDPGGPHVGPMNFAIWDVRRITKRTEGVCYNQWAPQMNFLCIFFSRVKQYYLWTPTHAAANFVWEIICCLRIGDVEPSTNFRHKSYYWYLCVSMDMTHHPRIYSLTKTHLASSPSVVKHSANGPGDTWGVSLTFRELFK